MDKFSVRDATNLRFDLRNRVLANIPSHSVEAGGEHGLGHPAQAADF